MATRFKIDHDAKDLLERAKKIAEETGTTLENVLSAMSIVSTSENENATRKHIEDMRYF